VLHRPVETARVIGNFAAVSQNAVSGMYAEAFLFITFEKLTFH
jgi:hypothetical protein